MKFVLLSMVLPALALGAIEGVVLNQTTSKPQSGASVTLIRLAGGMNTLGSAQSDAQGRFRLEHDLQADAPHLLQAMHQGVTYNKMLPPGSASTGIQVQIYDSSANAPDAKVSQHMILVEPSGNALDMRESMIFSNTGKVTFNRPDGTLRIYLPPQISGPARVQVTAPEGMPVQRPAEKTGEANVYVVKYPMRPGDTQIDVSYSMPAAAKFEGRILHGGGPVRVIAPQGVKLEGSALSQMGNEPRTQAMIYDLKGTNLAFGIQGTGSLRASAGAAAQGGEEDNTPGIEQAKPRIYKRLEWVLALTLVMLGIGFALLYRADVRA